MNNKHSASAGSLSLQSPTNLIMSAGGDNRITLDEQSGLNSYGCTPYPENVIAYASSTASTISAPAYATVEARHHALLNQSKAEDEAIVYHEAFATLRKRLFKAYQLPPSVGIAFGASGTDLELAVLAIALLADEQGVHNILVAPDEVGSGAEFAVNGQYFADQTALGFSVQKGSTIEGFDPASISMSSIEIRDGSGVPRSSNEIAEEIHDQISKSIRRGIRPIIHLVHRSKTGLMAPGWEEFHSFFERWGDSVDIVVDACQGRISPENVNRYLLDGAMVLYTGSKFIGGAPFSGALFVPENYTRRMSGTEKLPQGLGEFFTRSEWPIHWNAADGILSNQLNFGLLLRWESALYELERVLSIPVQKIFQTVKHFQDAVVQMVQKTDVVQLVDEKKDDEVNQHSAHPFEMDLIMTVAINAERPDNGKAMTIQDAKVIQKGLYSDISQLVAEGQQRLAKIVIHVSQPVKYSRLPGGAWQGTFRLALGAPLISDIAILDEGLIQNRFEADMDRILQKTELIIDHFELVEKL